MLSLHSKSAPILALLVVLLLTTFSTTTTAAASHDNSNNFMGFYSMPNASALHGWGNMWYSSSPSALVESRQKNGYTHQLFAIEGLFLQHTTTAPSGGLRLVDDWVSRWKDIYAPISKELLANGTIVGFFLGDELMWGGLPYEQLTEWSDLIRATFPTAFLWANEAFGVYHCDGWNKKGEGECIDVHKNVINITNGIPPALNATSIDSYFWSNSTFSMQDHVKAVEAYYNEFLYTKAHPGQVFFQIPGAAGSTHNPICDLKCYESVDIDHANKYLEWMVRDVKIVGMVPWPWENCRGCVRFKDEIGLENMPAARAHYQEVIAPAVMNISAEGLKEYRDNQLM